MDYENLRLVRMKEEVEKLKALKLLQWDEIRALKVEARAYQDELARMTISYEDELRRTRIPYQDELARMRKEIAKLEAVRQLQVDEIRALKVEARSYRDELAQLGKADEKMEAERLRQWEEIGALKVKARARQDELMQMRNEIGKLEAERLQHQEEIRELKVEALQETPARNIGREVRLRYLEKHRQRMGRRIGNLGRDRIKCGDRAAHRGRPVVDALLCLTDHVTDPDVYSDLYGVRPEIMKQWKDVQEIIEITGFRASLQSEGRLTQEFRAPFETLLGIASTFLSPTELLAAFGENKVLQQLHGQLQNCYDKIVAANPRCKSFV